MGKKQKQKVKWNLVFVFSAVISVGIALWGMIGKQSFESYANFLMQGLKEHFSWLYLVVMLAFVLFALIIAFSRFGTIRLGEDDEMPEYSTLSWFAMLFAAGMGIGLVFWGVAEPLSHYVAPMNGIEPLTQEAAHFSIRSCIMHWGLHPWACYTVMGLALAYFQFRKKETAMVSNMFKPLFGRKHAEGALGKMIDVITTVITAVGVATSFGMGCLQICAGLEHLLGIPNTAVTWVVVISVICFVYIQSAVRGVSKGIKLLSDINLYLCMLLLAAAFLVGPQNQILNGLVIGLKDYVVNFFQDSLRMSSNGDSSWIQNWRVFYWAWWLSWAPFVGVFIARISRGRTIREFVLGAMVVPTAVSAIWFSVFGGTALNVADHFSIEQLQAMAAQPQTAIFYIFDEYPFGMVLSIVAMVLLILFFITSADSATFVLSMLSSDGDLEPPNNKKFFWGILIAVIAFALIISGGISGIQTIAIVIAFPYLFILILIGFNLLIELIREKKM